MSGGDLGGGKGVERRASSHELREVKVGQGVRETREHREAVVVRSGSLGQELRQEAQVRKVPAETVNMRSQGHGQGQRRLVVTAGARTNNKGTTVGEGEIIESKQSLRETLKQSMTSGYCYRPAFMKNKS